MSRPYIRVVTELPPEEQLRWAKGDLAINEERLRQGRRDGMPMPGIEAYCAELRVRIRELERMVHD